MRMEGLVMNATFTLIDTAWGTFGFVTSGDALLATYLPATERYIRRAIAERWPHAVEDARALPVFRRNVNAYFQGKPTSFAVRVELNGDTVFRQRVIEACRRIPYGRTATYADLARAAGRPGAARAVGSTMAGNRCPIVVPCHRVVRADGGLGGFSSPDGVKQKRRLLELEGVSTPTSWATAV